MFRQSSGDLRRHYSSNFTCFVPKPSVPLQWNPRKLPNFNIFWNSLPPVPCRAYFFLGCPMHWRGFKLSPPTIQRSQHLQKKNSKISSSSAYFTQWHRLSTPLHFRCRSSLPASLPFLLSPPLHWKTSREASRHCGSISKSYPLCIGWIST